MLLINIKNGFFKKNSSFMIASLIKNTYLFPPLYLSTHSHHFTVFNSPFYFDDNVVITVTHSVYIYNVFFFQKKNTLII